MFAVGWMELKDPGRAWALLERSFANITEPFKVSLAPVWPSMPTVPSPALTTSPLQVWTENADGSGAVNFLTGMGGFLQAVLFGVTGFR